MNEEHNDFNDHDMCPDCKGTGQYIGFNIIEQCLKCEGAGWVPKGDGLNKKPKQISVFNF